MELLDDLGVGNRGRRLLVSSPTPGRLAVGPVGICSVPDSRRGFGGIGVRRSLANGILVAGRATVVDDTLAATRTLGLAHLAAVGDESGMEGVHVLRWHSCLENLVRFVGVDLRADDAQALADTVDVGVHRHGRHAEGEAQDDAGRLGTYSGQLTQPGAGFIHRHFGEEIEVERSVVEFQDALEDGLDAGRLDPGKTAARDSVLDVGDVRRRHVLEGVEAMHQVAEGALGIPVGRMLGKDGEDQLVCRVKARLVGKRAVFIGEQPDGIGDGHAGLFGTAGATGFGGAFGRHIRPSRMRQRDFSTGFPATVVCSATGPKGPLPTTRSSSRTERLQGWLAGCGVAVWGGGWEGRVTRGVRNKAGSETAMQATALRVTDN